ncbi:MAG: TrlF family AAA-like ATPase, partial [bacterium]
MNRIRYARYWKCALQVNPWDYAAKYRGVNHGLDEAAYNQEVLNVCKDEGIEVVGVADHGSVTSIDGLRHVLTEDGITVFPGFEIASSEKAHFVCLFEAGTSVEQLNRYLGALDLLKPQDGVRPSSLSAVQLLDKVEELGGFVYAAHCTEDNGVLRRGLNHVWQDARLHAAQIPGALEDLKNEEDHGYRQILRNKNPDYKRERPIGIINASDVAVPEDLRADQCCCLIRMTDPDFAAFKQAFLDPESRVRLVTDRRETHFSEIERVRMTGGYLDGLDVQLSGHLDTVIGGRGTGKTTLIECIRYALEREPLGDEAGQIHTEVVRHNLGMGGRIEVTLRSHALHGRRFTVARRYGEPPMVRDDETGESSAMTPAELLPQVEMFGQNEIHEVASTATGRSRLVRRLVRGDPDVEPQLEQIRRKLHVNTRKLLEAQGKLAEMEGRMEALPRLEERERQFRELGLRERLAVVPKLEKEKGLARRVEEDQSNVRESLDAFRDALPDPAYLADTALEGLPHADPLRQAGCRLRELRGALEQMITHSGEAIDTAESKLTALLSELHEGISSEEDAVQQALKQVPDFQGRSGREIGTEYQKLLREIEQVRSLDGERRKHKAVVQAFEKDRQNLLRHQSELSSQRAAAIQRELKKLKRRLAGQVRPSIEPERDREPLKRFLLECNLDKVGKARLAWIDDAEQLTPVALAAAIRDGAEALQAKGWRIPPVVANALAKMPEAKRLELEAMRLPDRIHLELNLHDQGQQGYRPIEHLSTGQQSTAVLHLLLLDNRDPLIIDQPEDNLDNAFIADHIVREIRQGKLERQFLFATHNANIPVFGDAEWIGVMEV